MTQKIIVAPSILSADAAHLAAEVKKVEAAGADWIHVDVMDGHFVKNLTYGSQVVKALQKITGLPLDVHLMIENPHLYIPRFTEAGAGYISIHIEASQDVERDIKLIHQGGAKAAIAVSPSTPIDRVFPYLKHVEMVLVMSVDPGFEKQAFIPDVLSKIPLLKNELQRIGHEVHIEVDGGVNGETSRRCVEAGANVLVSGSAIYYAKDPTAVIQQLKSLGQS